MAFRGPKGSFTSRVLSTLGDALVAVFQRAKLPVGKRLEPPQEAIQRLQQQEKDPYADIDALGRTAAVNFRLLRAMVLGAGPWDLKPGLLASRKAQMNAAKSLANSAKTGKPPSGPWLDVPLHVHGHADLSLPRGPVSPFGAGPNAGMFLPPRKRRPRSEGEVGFDRGRVVFVRVSMKSKPESWIHPGFGRRAEATGYGIRERTTGATWERGKYEERSFYASVPVWQRIKRDYKEFYEAIKTELQREMRRRREGRGK